MTKRFIIDEFRGEYFFLSNFYAIPIVFQNLMYPSAEHAFQAAKTLDKRVRVKIARNPSPSMAKRYGRALVLRPDWEEIKVHVMEEIIREKFGKTVLKRRLLATKDSLLIEGNTWGDNFWGATRVGRGKIWEGNNHNWYGRNELGRILMDLREKLRG